MAEPGTPSPVATADRVILRSWPKIILMLPTMFMGLFCGIMMALRDPPDAGAGFGFVHFLGLLFLFVLMINLTMLLYDLSLRGFLIVALLIVVLILALFLFNRSAENNVWGTLGRALSVRVYANPAFYFLFALVLFLNLLIAWVITRFHYWVVERNEIIIHRGFMQEQERHPTAQARFKLVIDDVVEYGMLGCGKLVFYFGDDSTEHELPTIPFVHKKVRILDDLLGRVAVIQS